MNANFPAIVNDLWSLAGWTMVHFLWLGAIVAAFAFAGRMLLRNAAANIRYIFALACLALITAVPLAAAWLFEPSPSGRGQGEGALPTGINTALPSSAVTKIPSPTPPIIELHTPLSDAAATTAIADSPALKGEARGGILNNASQPSALNPQPSTVWPSTLDPSPRSLLVPRSSLLSSAIPYLPWLWLIGTPLTFALLFTGLIGTRRLSRASTPITTGPVADALARLTASLRITRRVTVAVCERVAAPVLIGIVRPMILLPPAALTGWSPDEIEMVLLHELAHIRRYDNVVNLAQRIIESLLFFHPAVWLISTWVRREREACCDAAVVTRTQKPHAYATLLVNLAAQVLPSPSGRRPSPTEPSPAGRAQLVVEPSPSGRGQGEGAPRIAPAIFSTASPMAAGPLRTRIRHILQLEDDPMLITPKSLAIALATLLTAATLAFVYLPKIGQAEQPATEATETTEKKQEKSETKKTEPAPMPKEIPFRFLLKREASGQIQMYLNGGPISDEKILSEIAGRVKANRELRTSLLAEKDVPKDEVQRVVELIQSLGVKYVLLDSPEEWSKWDWQFTVRKDNPMQTRTRDVHPTARESVRHALEALQQDPYGPMLTFDAKWNSDQSKLTITAPQAAQPWLELAVREVEDNESNAKASKTQQSSSALVRVAQKLASRTGEQSATEATEKKQADADAGNSDIEKLRRIENDLKTVEIVVVLFNNQEASFSSGLHMAHEELAKKHRSLYTYGAQLDPTSPEAKRYGLKDSPTCIIFIHGKEAGRLDTIRSGDQLQEFIRTTINKADKPTTVGTEDTEKPENTETTSNEEWLNNVTFPSPKDQEIAKRAWLELGVKFVTPSNDDLEIIRRNGLKGGLKSLDLEDRLNLQGPLILTDIQTKISSKGIPHFAALAEALNEIDTLPAGERIVLNGITKGGGTFQYMLKRHQNAADYVKFRSGLDTIYTPANSDTWRAKYSDIPASSTENATSPTKFPSLEDQKLADLAWKRLGVEMEPIAGDDLQRVKALGYDGGVKVAANDGHTVAWEGQNSIQPNDILVGLHVWPTTNLKDIATVLNRDDLAELNPLKFYVVRPGAGKNQTGPMRQPEEDSVVSGRINVQLAGDPAADRARLEQAKHVASAAVLKAANEAESLIPPLQEAKSKLRLAVAKGEDVEAARRVFDSANHEYDAARERWMAAQSRESEIIRAINALPSKQPAPQPLPLPPSPSDSGSSTAPSPLPSATSTPASNPLAPATAAEIEVLRERVKMIEERYRSIEALHKTAARGGSTDAYEVSAYELALARGELALAEGKHDAAQKSFAEARQHAEAAFQAVNAAYQSGRITYDRVLEAARNLSDIKLRLIRLAALTSPPAKPDTSPPTSNAPSPPNQGTPNRYDAGPSTATPTPPTENSPVLHSVLINPSNPQSIPPAPRASQLAPSSSPLTAQASLRYDGKPFEEWRNVWKTELSTQKRLEALKALEAFAAAGMEKEVNSAILDGIYSDSQATAQQIRKRLSRLNPTDAAPVVRSLQSTIKSELSSRRRIDALRALAAIGPNAAAALDDLKVVLATKDPQIRIAAATAIKRIVGKDQYQKPLADVLGNELGIEVAKTNTGEWGAVPRDANTNTDAYLKFTEDVIKEQELLFPPELPPTPPPPPH